MIDFQQALEIFKREKLKFGDPDHIEARNVLRKVTASTPVKLQMLYDLKLDLQQKYGKRYPAWYGTV